MVWRHADFILRRDEVSGVEVFIKHHELNSDEEKCEAIVTFLQQYPIARRIYLEHLVNTKELQVSHSSLGWARIKKISICYFILITID